MKPVSIHIKNIGPFVDEKLDFTQLEEIFLLCGDTGAGKTTIFDAMTFALYGEFLGARKGKASDFRSHFALDGEVSSVEFEFTSGGEKFRVNRKLPYEKLGRNNKLVKKDSEVSLDVWNESKKQYESFNGNKTEIKEKLEEVIGLKADEFSKIVVLPQGEFSKFLRSNSNAKQEMLKKLFPVDFYQSIVERIKKQHDEMSTEMKSIESSMNELTKEMDFSEAGNKIEELEKNLQEKKILLDEMRRKKEEFNRQLTVLEGELKTSVELEESIGKKDALEKKLPNMELLEKKILLADEADLIIPFVESKNVRLAEEKSAEKYFEDSRILAGEAEKKYESLRLQEDEISKTEKSMEENKIQLKILSDKLELAQKYESQLKKRDEAKKKCESFESYILELGCKRKSLLEEQKKLAESAGITDDCADGNTLYRLVTEKLSAAKETSAGALKILGSARQASGMERKISESEKESHELECERKELEGNIENSRKLLEEYRQKKEVQVAANTAVTLVSRLVPGCPCPVCGSTEHPSPAKVSEEFLDLDEKIQTVEHSIESEKKILSMCSEKLAATKEVLGKYAEDLLRLKNECNGLSEKDAEAAEEKAKNEMHRFQELCQKCKKLMEDMESVSEKISLAKDESSSATEEFASINATVKAIEDQMNKSGDSNVDFAKIKKQMEDLESLVESRRKLVEDFRRNFMNADRELGKAKTRFEESGVSLESARKNSVQAMEILGKKLSGSKFRDEKNVLENRLEKKEKENFRRETEEFRSELLRLENSIDVLSKKTSEKPEQLGKKREDVALKIESAEKAIAEISDSVDQLLSEKTSYEKDYVQFKKYFERHAALAEKLAPLAQLHKNLSGDNPSKTPFETWFLGLYFDDVVVCANRHLLKISGERYEFILDTDKSGGNLRRGLDLLVHDYQTNRDRDSAMLSGGETFMASISLALGLTEVVQKTSRMDSLFIDEGFGSLDKESLEMAVGVLQDIGSSRMVGIISHVEEMLGAIPCHVKVSKTARGSHISV